MGKSYSGHKSSIDQEDEGNKDADLGNQVQEALEGHEYKHFSVYAEAENNGDFDYVSMSASVAFGFDKSELIMSFPTYDNSDWKSRRELEEKIKDSLDFYTIEQIEFDSRSWEGNNKVWVNVSFRDEEDQGNIE